MIDYRQKIKLLILKKQTNKAQVARRANISYSTIHSFLKGKSNMNLKTLKKILHVLEIM